MSRCFPFPPPGYEKKPRPEDGDLLKEEKRKEKKHKKEKKDREKKEGKEKRDKDRSDGKHREKKDKKDKHRDKKEKHKDKKDKEKDKDKDKERSDISEEARVDVLPGVSSGQKLPSRDEHFKKESINSQEAKYRDQSQGPHAEKLFKTSLPTVETEESKFVQELARRIRNEQKGAGSQLAERFPVESKRDEKTNTYIKDFGNFVEEKEKKQEKRVYSNKMDGHQVRVEPRIGVNSILPSFPDMAKSKFHGLPPLEENVESRREEKEKSKEKRDDRPREKKKDKEKDAKSHAKEKDREKEKKKENKAKDKSAHRKSEPVQFDAFFLILEHPALSHLMSRKRNVIVATGLLAFAAAGLSFPFYMASRSSRATPVIDSSKPLPPQATFRGPYINTGSRDIGPDHQTYTKK